MMNKNNKIEKLYKKYALQILFENEINQTFQKVYGFEFKTKKSIKLQKKINSKYSKTKQSKRIFWNKWGEIWQ